MIATAAAETRSVNLVNFLLRFVYEAMWSTVFDAWRGVLYLGGIVNLKKRQFSYFLGFSVLSDGNG